MSNPIINKTAEGRTRSNESRAAAAVRKPERVHRGVAPAAGAHAASHLINEDATPGAGALPSYDHSGGKEVDGGAG